MTKAGGRGGVVVTRFKFRNEITHCLRYDLSRLICLTCNEIAYNSVSLLYYTTTLYDPSRKSLLQSNMSTIIYV